MLVGYFYCLCIIASFFLFVTHAGASLFDVVNSESVLLFVGASSFRLLSMFTQYVCYMFQKFKSVIASTLLLCNAKHGLDVK